MYDFNRLFEVVEKNKKCLEKYYKVVYIKNKTSQKEEKIEETKNDLSLFKIEKKREPIFNKIISIDSLEKVKDEIKNEYKNFIDDFLEYFERVEGQLNENQIKSFEIIEKTLNNRGKKLNSTIDRFQVEDNWKVFKIKEEFYFKIEQNLKDIINTLTPTISTGLKENSAYEGVLKIFNQFLSKLGIYTKEFKEDEECDYNILDPQECDDCDTKDKTKRDIIKEILSYPYLIDENRVVAEGRVIIWRIKHNG